MKIKKTLVATAIGTAVSLAGSVGVNADPVNSWDLEDFNGDGLRSDFTFFAVPPGNSGNQFGSAGESGCTNAFDGNTCDPIAFDLGAIAPLTFTTGFDFGNTGSFLPNITGNISADISGPIDGDGSNNTLTLLAFDFGGIFPGQTGSQFVLPPDSLVNCTGTPGCATSGGYEVESLTDNSDGTFGVTIRYVGTILVPGSSFFNFTSNWRLEGTMDTNPVGVPRISVSIDVPGGATQECATTGGSDVTLNAGIVLINDAELASIEWSVDGMPVGSGATITPFLGLGLHTISVEATAVTGQNSQDSVEVTITDTTAPDLTVAFVDKKTGLPVTLATKKVKKVVTSFVATDICDPDPVTHGVGGFAVESGDVIKLKSRKGKVKFETTELTLMATVTDASGNSVFGETSLAIVGGGGGSDGDDDSDGGEDDSG